VLLDLGIHNLPGCYAVRGRTLTTQTSNLGWIHSVCVCVCVCV
jgi:hypothetical protein